MNTDEAIHTLRKHNGEFAHETDTFLDSLRPYSGIESSHFSEIVKALYFAAPCINTPQADRNLIHTIWNLTRCARLWTTGPHEPMFHGRDFIAPTEKQTVDRWIYTFETITLDLLRGFADWEAIDGLSEEINMHDSLTDTDWLIEPFTKSLEYHLEMEIEGGFGDDAESLCKSFVRIGPAAQTAIPILSRVASNTKFPKVKSEAETAIEILSGNNST